MNKRPIGLFLVSLVAAQMTVATVCHAQTPPPPPPAPAQWPPPYGSYPYPPNYPPPNLTLSGPLVTFVNDNPRARLQQMQFARWRDVCLAPCGQQLDPGGFYRVGGGSVIPSPQFQLPRESQFVTVNAQTGSVVKKWVGFGVGIGGVVAAGYGGLYYLLGRSINNDSEFHDTGAGSIFTSFGGYLLLTGAVLMAIGFPIFASQHTSVDVH
jgi:hypothetical protein